MLRSIVALTVVLVAMPTTAAVLTGPVVNPANGNSYYLLESATWTDSQAEAETLGGNLATINDAAENGWVFDSFSNFGGIERNLWIGLSDAASEGNFQWASGEPFDYTNWSGTQPDNGGAGTGAENYVHMLFPTHPTPGAWNDAMDLAAVISRPLNGVVEVVIPEPCTLALTGLAVSAFGVVRRR